MRFSDAVEFLTSVVAYNIDEMNANLAQGINRTSDYIIPFFQGDPGVGKTAIPATVAQLYDVPYGQAIVAQYDAGEMAGIPYIRPVKKEVEDENGEIIETDDYILTRERPDYLPTFEAGIFNLDEMPQAFLANQNICSQLVNEYRIGHHAISPGITIVATGNKPENKAGTTTIPSHLKDRIMPLTIEPDCDEWLKYAAGKGIDPRIRAYLRENPGKLHDFDPKQSSYPTPRSWEKTSTVLNLSIMKAAEGGDKSHIREGMLSEVVQAQIGEPHGHSFISWLRVEDKMPKLSEVINRPEETQVFGAEDASLNYLLLSSLADAANKKNITNIIKYIKRIPNPEFMAMWAQDAFTRDRSLLKTSAAQQWMMTSGTQLLL